MATANNVLQFQCSNNYLNFQQGWWLLDSDEVKMRFRHVIIVDVDVDF